MMDPLKIFNTKSFQVVGNHGYPHKQNDPPNPNKTKQTAPPQKKRKSEIRLMNNFALKICLF